jgi:hypothetical protein
LFLASGTSFLLVKFSFPAGTLYFDEEQVFSVVRDGEFAPFGIVAERFPRDNPIVQRLETETDSKLVQSLVSLRPPAIKSSHEVVNSSLLLSK